MSLTPTSFPAPPSVRSPDLLRRIALPFLCFALTLTGLLVLSWFLLVPRFSRVDVGGIKRTSEEIRTYRSALTAQIAGAEAKRREFLLPLRDPLFVALKEQRQLSPVFEEALAMITRQAAALSPSPDAIHIARWHFSQKSLVLDGDVRFAGSASMTVLASFAEALEALPVVASVEAPTFTRADDPVTGPHSPFHITLTLR